MISEKRAILRCHFIVAIGRNSYLTYKTEDI